MLYTHDRLELRKSGRAARAEIITMRTEGHGSKATALGATDDDLTKAWTNCWLQLRVLPEGATPSRSSTTRTITTRC